MALQHLPRRERRNEPSRPRRLDNFLASEHAPDRVENIQKLHILCRPCESAFDSVFKIKNGKEDLGFWFRKQKVLHANMRELRDCVVTTNCHFCSMLAHTAVDDNYAKYHSLACLKTPPPKPGISFVVVQPEERPKRMNPFAWGKEDKPHLKVTFTNGQFGTGEPSDRRFDLSLEPLPSTPVIRNPAEARKTDSERLVQWVKGCITACEQRHKIECGNRRKPLLPSRLLAITRPEQRNYRVKLYLTSDDDGRKDYCALSYCWGGVSNVLKLRSEDDMKDFQIDIPFENLSECHQDAVDLTYRLGVRYLWIDALCIIQGQAADFTKESLKMGDIYAGAWCTIVATHTENPTKHLYLSRAPRITQSCIVKRSKTHALVVMDEKSTNPPGDRLTTRRGWCMQEAMLSRRTICFGSKVWFFCNKAAVFENYSFFEDFAEMSTDPNYHRQGLKEVYRLPMMELRSADSCSTTYIAEAWARLVFNYTSRAFSDPLDLLLALAGIAQGLMRRFPLTYCAGMWLETFPLGLLWRTASSGRRCIPYRAPTWSWASCTGPISHEDWSDVPFKDIHSTIDIVVECDPMDDTKTGKVFDGHMKVTGPLNEIRIGGVSGLLDIRVMGSWIMFTGRVSADVPLATEDTEDSSSDHSSPAESSTGVGRLWDRIHGNSKKLYIWPLLIRGYHRQVRGSLFRRSDTWQELTGLVLLKKDGWYERVGLAEIQRDGFKDPGPRDFSLFSYITEEWPRQTFIIR